METADFEIVEVEHTVEALTKLLTGKKVMLNMVGPYAQFGAEVVEACYNAGVHYTDCTGEQPWFLRCRDEFGAKFARKKLVLYPGTGQIFTVTEIAVYYCLGNPGLDTLDMVGFWKGTPTIASTASIVQGLSIGAPSYYLAENRLVAYEADDQLFEVAVPGQHELGLAHPWTGTGIPVFFQQDSRVRNCRLVAGVINRPLMLGVPDMVRNLRAAIAGKSPDEALKIMAGAAAQVNNTDPPRERATLNVSIDSVRASGPLGRAHCVIYGNSNYKQTGLLQAWTGAQLLTAPPRRFSFASTCQALDHRELHGVLRAHGLSMAPITNYHGV